MIALQSRTNNPAARYLCRRYLAARGHASTEVTVRCGLKPVNRQISAFSQDVSTRSLQLTGCQAATDGKGAAVLHNLPRAVGVIARSLRRGNPQFATCALGVIARSVATWQPTHLHSVSTILHPSLRGAPKNRVVGRGNPPLAAVFSECQLPHHNSLTIRCTVKF